MTLRSLDINDTVSDLIDDTVNDTAVINKVKKPLETSYNAAVTSTLLIDDILRDDLIEGITFLIIN